MVQRVLCLDYGERRIGVAISDEAGIIAMPLCVIDVRDSGQTLREIAGICAEKKPEKKAKAEKPAVEDPLDAIGKILENGSAPAKPGARLKELPKSDVGLPPGGVTGSAP